MSEENLREKFVGEARSYLGTSAGSPQHHELVNLYNSHRPLARGYMLKYSDPWCAGFVSAISIRLGLTDIVFTEVGTDAMIRLYREKNCWVEYDGYVPSAGDLIFYDWDDSGDGDNQQATSHVGIVSKVYNGRIYTIEGNVGNRVSSRDIPLNGRFIRGFATPDYQSKVYEEEEAMYDSLDQLPDWARPTIEKLMEKGFLKGNEKGELGLTMSMVRVFVVHDRAGMYDGTGGVM